MSWRSLDALEHLLIKLETEQEWMDSFSRTVNTDEVIDLAHQIGIVITEEQMLDLLGGQGHHLWICGGSDFHPIRHLKKLFLAR